LMVTETQLSAEKLKKGNLKDHEWEQLNKQVSKISEAPLFIDDTPSLSIFELRAKSRRLKQQHNLGLIIIDYLQLMTAGGEGNGNREQEISFISRSLKSIGKELGVPVIALSQLSRAVETRGGDKRPQLSDLRESGAIEQDADMVMFLYRPEYYKINEDENGNSLLGIGEVIVAKHRNGALKNIPLRFIDTLAKFEDLDSNQFGVITAGESGGPSTVIKSSRMNEEWNNDETPF
ncbi:MAG: DnaB-like helicase C-terminal domain-containing protein, partial [Bacteroidetes bacterium]|nr:DnaB-like helicase C-terminal domain-containing protein [Bacteroidota bacterium]